MEFGIVHRGDEFAKFLPNMDRFLYGARGRMVKLKGLGTPSPASIHLLLVRGLS
jgi:hypothetical protein